MARGNAAKLTTPPRQKRRQQDMEIIDFSLSNGMDTREQRDAIREGFWSWLMNFQPIGVRTLRALNGKAANINTLVSDTIVSMMTWQTNSTHQFVVEFTLAGAAYQINTGTQAVVTIGAAATFYDGVNQYPPQAVAFGSSGIIIISNLGYWAWDGTTLFAAGAEAPSWLSGNTTPATPTGTATNGSAHITGLSSTSGISVGMADFSGSYLPASATVVSIDSATQITMSANFTGVTGPFTFKFDWPMPSGISGNGIEIYNASPWIVKGRTIIASAPGNGADFAVSDGAVSATVKDSYVQDGYSGLRQLDGFLYLFAHSAVDVISDVSTSGSPATTTFLRTNVSPLIGTPWRDSIVQLPSSIAFANKNGIHEVSGGQAKKVSDPLDGIFSTATFPTFPSACAVSLSETTCYALSMIVTDPDSGVSTNGLGVWDGRRFFLANQELSITTITTKDNDSVLTAWATDGTHLFNAFATPSATLGKKAKSWLSDGKSGITMRKEIKRYYAQFANVPTGGLITFDIDTEAVSVTAPSINANLQFINNSGGKLNFVNNSNLTLQFISATYPLVFAASPGTGIICILFGITVSTFVTALDIVAMKIGYVDYSIVQ